MSYRQLFENYHYITETYKNREPREPREHWIYPDAPLEVELPDGVFIREPSAKYYRLGFAHEISDNYPYLSVFKPYNS